MRMSTVIGMVGGGGVGFLVYQWDQLDAVQAGRGGSVGHQYSGVGDGLRQQCGAGEDSVAASV